LVPGLRIGQRGVPIHGAVVAEAIGADDAALLGRHVLCVEQRTNQGEHRHGQMPSSSHELHCLISFPLQINYQTFETLRNCTCNHVVTSDWYCARRTDRAMVEHHTLIDLCSG
jgi:hypothetical protein